MISRRTASPLGCQGWVWKDIGLSRPEPRSEERSRCQYSFADFTLDLEAGFLRRGVEEVTLSPKAFEVLAYLVEHHGRLVTKTALIEGVWPDTAITDNSLAQRLLEIRRALDDDSQRLIRTVARRGYVFTAAVTTPVVQFPREPAGAPAEPGPPPASPVPAARKTLNSKIVASGFVLLAIAAGGLLLMRLTPQAKHEGTYTQITNFTDSAVGPALSPDGRMVVFFRSDNWFLTPDQVYVKMLPDGEPVQLTHDSKWKYGLAFSPDGSRIAYTVAQGGPSGWKTYTVSPLGGEPSLLLANAAGLTWLDRRRLLFSAIRTGEHMGVVTATENRSEYRELYFPQNERGMAHYSYASPDRNWALVVEMDPVWQRCRLIPLDGSSAGRQVGPQGKCHSAAWSPDGKWMYFGAEVEGNHHLWRQRFPAGEPEQITFGPTEEAGVAVAPDGRSLITSIGIQESAIWIHDALGERPISSEGHVISDPGWSSSVTFSSDGKSLFYLMRRESLASLSELWRTDLESGKSERALPGFSMAGYDISSDGKEVVFSIQSSGKASQFWLAPLDRSAPPKLIASAGESSPDFGPHFGPDGQVLFVWRDGNANYLARMNKDGSDRSKVAPYPISGIYGAISPDRRWIVASIPAPDVSVGAIVAVPTGGGAPRRICAGFRPVAWAPDGKFFYIGVARSSRTSPGKTLAIPVQTGETLPDLPASGIRGLDDAAAFPGSRLIEGWVISPGPDPSVFAYVKTTMHRNLFRIPLGSQ
jgi:DNA-binding winged helix-turn-helix (wHTH) protein/Tol biopolymer transport system component